MVRPKGLGSRGRRLWKEATPELLTPQHRELLVEACRIADRLERLDGLLRGDEDVWLRLRLEGAEVTVTVGAVLSEARQQATALKGILSELRQGQQSPEALFPPQEPAAADKGGPGVSDLTARIAARRASPEG